jgi:SAM-dependent methyltransferase
MFDAFGATAQGMGWGTKGLQHLRFQALTSPWTLEGKSVLDIGCGICDLYNFLKPKLISQYVGIDFVDSYYRFAKLQYRDPIFEVIKADIYSLLSFPCCDIALASGTFNVMDAQSEAENYQRIQLTMSRMRAAARIGFSINFLSDATTYRDNSLFYANSETILAIARKISRRVLLSHVEFPFEFTIHVWSEDSYDSNKSLFCDPIE